MGVNSNRWMERASSVVPRVVNFVEGVGSSVNGEQRIEKYCPRDGRILAEFGNSETHDVNCAVASARRAFEDGRWSQLGVHQRKAVILKFASLIEKNTEQFALLESLDVGKPISQALSFDVPAAVATMRFNAEAADKVCGRVYGVDGTSMSYELRRPLGVVAGLVGWNFPLLLAVTKVAPALMTGNCLVLKPSEHTSFSAGRLAEIAIEAGVPEGVFNVVNGGPSTGAALAYHADVDALTFTGSTRTGKRLMIAAAESNMKRLLLECGGKAPNIVFEDCPDLDVVADAVVARAFWNQGQVCSASSRLLVQESIRRELIPRIVDRAAMLSPKDPLDEDCRFGAITSRAHLRVIESYIESGEREGATIVYRSTASPPFDGGFYISPTIFDNVLPAYRIAQEEIFGPVLSVIGFRDEDEAIKIANGTLYGLSAIVWTRDMRLAHRMTQEIKAGWIVVNATDAPKGGPGAGVLSIGGHKQSGWGVEGGVDGLTEYVSRTAVQLFV